MLALPHEHGRSTLSRRAPKLTAEAVCVAVAVYPIHAAVVVLAIIGLVRALHQNLHVCVYVGVGELEDVRAFYYSIESKNNPKEDPPMLWLTVALVAHGDCIPY
ncbi:hypothetical protein JHK87_027441 [Glycine soja]|nr:hypothetical protein JHK87_027441 [Glycine soja]